MKLGIGSYCFGWAVEQGALDAPAIVRLAHSFSLTLAQLGDHLPLNKLSASALDALADEADALGVELEVGMRGFTRENILRYIEVCDRLGAKLLRVIIDAPGYEPTVEEVLEEFRQVEAALSRAHVVLAIENHDRFAARELAGLVKKADSTQLGICLDMVNSMGAGEGIETVFTHLMPHTVNVHLKDFAVTRLSYLQGFAVEGRPAGQGMLPIPDILKKIAEMPLPPNVLLEIWTPPERTMADTLLKESRWAHESVSYVREQWKTLGFPGSFASESGGS